MKVIWSTVAWVDLEVIYDFLAEKSDAAALRIAEGNIEVDKADRNLPESEAIKGTLRTTEKIYRHLIERDYKIIYSYHPSMQVAYIETSFDTLLDPDLLKV